MIPCCSRHGTIKSVKSNCETGSTATNHQIEHHSPFPPPFFTNDPIKK
jgi:hypothetical protein